ncbi:MAG: TatD family hydrolase [Clostridiales Family XIII bacterium]|jgi:TatD DNase family protein|nr:TatD family hydrolase [Clostridiales Family XIII bacterium]
MLFDSHAHINYDGYDDAELRNAIAAIEASDVGAAVDVGFDIKSSVAAVAHAAKYPWCYAAVGVHPHEAAKMDEDKFARLAELSRMAGVVAIGEIGLDYYRNLSPKEDQHVWFRRQIRLGLERRLPIIIHDRDSEGDTMNILVEEGAFGSERRAAFPKNPQTGRESAGILLHCFSGSAEQALECIEMGATISIAGPVTYKKNIKTALVAERTPLSHLLIETDAPYLAPEPFRGKPNISPYVYYTAKRIAELKGVDVAEVETATWVNARRFFRIE